MYKTFIIAEAGVNHNGSLKTAKKLVDAAKAAGADAIKFQTFKAEALATRSAPKAKYQKISAKKESQLEMLKKLELSEAEFKELFKYCKQKGIIFLSTPFDEESAEFLNQLGVSKFKIGSGDVTNVPLLKRIAGYKKPIILSTGMSTLKEVREAVRVIYSAGNKKVSLLHCTSNYPARYGDVNLKAMETLREIFKVPVGYSDHTLGIEMAVAAVAMGARVIEKHFTLNNNFKGPDHKVSLEPKEFKQMVQAIRKTETAMGDGIKRPRGSELEVAKVARKSIVAACNIPEGVIITKAMLTVKRPGTGLKPRFLNKVIGRKAKFDIPKDELLSWSAIQ